MDQPKGKPKKKEDLRPTLELHPVHETWHKIHIEQNTEMKVEIATGRIIGELLVVCDDCPQRSVCAIGKVPGFHVAPKER